MVERQFRLFGCSSRIYFLQLLSCNGKEDILNLEAMDKRWELTANMKM